MEFNYRQAQPDDLKQVTEIIDQELYKSNKDTLARLVSQDYAIVAESENTIVGVVLAFMVSEENQAFSEGKEYFNQAFELNQESTGVIKSLVVKPAFRNKGIGTQLVKLSKETLESQGAARVISSVWVKPNGTVTVKGPLESNNMEELVHIERFWDREVGVKRPCKECGSECKCSAIIYCAEKSAIEL
jgi:predicted N-acetyltransferase YhbS